MRRLLPMNSKALLTLLWLSALFGLASSCAYADSNNTSTYTDADFAANAVKAPAVDNTVDPYGFRRRYAEIIAARQRDNDARQQMQQAEAEQKERDAQFSFLPRTNESDAEYQARMEKERNPVWLKHQALAKLQEQIQAQKEAKLNQQAVSTAPNNTDTVDKNALQSNGSGLIETTANPASPTQDLQSLSVNPPVPKVSPDSIPSAISMGNIGYSLFYIAGFACCAIFLGWALRRPR